MKTRFYIGLNIVIICTVYFIDDVLIRHRSLSEIDWVSLMIMLIISTVVTYLTSKKNRLLTKVTSQILTPRSLSSSHIV